MGLHPRLQDRQRVLMGFAVVDDHRFAQVGGKLELGFEGAALHVPGVGIPMVVQANLPDGDDFGMPGQFTQFRQGLAVHVAGVEGINPYRRPHLGVAFGQGDDRPARLQPRADADHRRDPGLDRSFDDPLPILVELLRVQVTVGIHQHLSSTCADPKGFRNP